MKKKLIITYVWVDFDYSRTNGDSGHSKVCFGKESFGNEGKEWNKKEIRNMIYEYFRGFRGKGLITINWIDCGGNFHKINELEDWEQKLEEKLDTFVRTDELEEWEEKFNGKQIKFNNFV